MPCSAYCTPLLTIAHPRRIRRVKCDENKPNCDRCTSTGRNCDGYSSPFRAVGTLPLAGKKRRGHVQHPSSMVLHTSFSHNVQGTNTERQFFSTYVRFAGANTIRHCCNVPNIWVRLLPQLAHQSHAVKHALVAFGAAYQCFKSTCGGTNGDAVVTNNSDWLSRLTLQQYNKAIRDICKTPTRSDLAGEKLALVCCLIFICLESLRLNHHAALWHMNNGTRIIGRILSDQNVQGPASSGLRRRCNTTDSLDADLKDIIQQFRNYQACLAGQSLNGTKPDDDLPAESPRPSVDRSAVPVLYTVPDSHLARIRLGNTVLKLESHDGNTKAVHCRHDEAIHQQLSETQQQALQIDNALEAFLAGSHAPPRTDSSFYAVCIDIMHVVRMRGSLHEAALASGAQRSDILPPSFHMSFVNRIIQYGEDIHAAFRSGTVRQPEFALETAIIGPLRWAYEQSTDLELKRRAHKILQETMEGGRVSTRIPF